MTRNGSASRSLTLDAIVLGAGAAGLFYAAQAGAGGLRTLVLDHSAKPAEKVRISGGGRCNFTNIHTTAQNFISGNPHFAKSALARYTPWDFVALMERHGLSWHEKTLGQLFCDQKSSAVIQLLLDEVAAGAGDVRLSAPIADIGHADGRFTVRYEGGAATAPRLVVATGGLSIPKIGATGLAYDIARRFGHTVIKPEPALVPFTFEGAEKAAFAGLSGVSAPVRARAGEGVFDEALLFTHRGLSGPAMLQVSSYWHEGEPVEIDLFAGADGSAQLRALKAGHPAKGLGTALTQVFPRRLAEYIAESGLAPAFPRLADASHAELDAAAERLSRWSVTPSGTEGWRTAEVTRGGVDTAGLSSKTLESRHVPGLHFIGECVDVTGWLGGYNFQWAWASAHAAAMAEP
ncbi:MAG: NAD(P)/FAD-dependent oxidoreductase [Alphaproteobacteria bacterium]|nr:NAD(P)/FAD-dependent oxidoreductase [Alphaproteobacteria bacterium]